MSMGLRPYLSLNGPQMSMERAKRSMKQLKVRLTRSGVAESCTVMPGSAGR